MALNRDGMNFCVVIDIIGIFAFVSTHNQRKSAVRKTKVIATNLRAIFWTSGKLVMLTNARSQSAALII